MNSRNQGAATSDAGVLASAKMNHKRLLDLIVAFGDACFQAILNIKKLDQCEIGSNFGFRSMNWAICKGD